jgi:hypothetical protein
MTSGQSWQPWRDDRRWRREFGAGGGARASEQWVWGAAPEGGAGVRWRRRGDRLFVEVDVGRGQGRAVDVHVGRNAILVRSGAGSRRVDLPVTVQGARARVRRRADGITVTVPLGE